MDNGDILTEIDHELEPGRNKAVINGKKIGIDARMIEMSGIGVYIQHLLGQGIYDCALGKEEEIRKYDRDVRVIPYDATIYTPKEQIDFPNKAVKNAKIEIMHFPHYNVPISYRGKYVVTVHDLTHILLPEYLGGKAKYIYARFLMNQAVSRASHVFTVSENSKKDIQKYFRIPESKICITYNAIDDDFCVKDKAEIKYLYEKYGIPRDKKTVLYVGNLKPHKNLSTLLKALKILNSEEVVLLLVGKAFKSVDLADQEETLGIQDKIIHTGMVSKNEIIDFYNLADLFVFPSLYEGFGIPPLEAMACGTPVIAANNSSIPEVCGDAAILFDGKSEKELAERIEQVLTSEAVRQDLVNKGMLRKKHFNWEQTRSEIMKVLTQLTTSA